MASPETLRETQLKRFAVMVEKMKHFVFVQTVVLAFTCLLVQTPPAFAESHDYKKQLEHGVHQLEKKDYQGAIASFTTVLRDSPNNYEAYLDRAEARKGIKDFAAALSDYDQAVKINPNVVEAYFKRGQVKEDQGDRPGAIDDYSQALSLNPKDVTAILLLAEALKRNGDYSKSAEMYNEALKLQPGSITARQECADCKVKSGNYDGAAEDYRFLLKKYKQLFALHYDLGHVLQLKGDTQGAKEQFQQVIDYYSKTLGHAHDKGKDYIARGLSYFQLGEKDKAIHDLEQGVSLLPGDADAQAQLGQMRLEAGDTTGAIKDLNEALAKDSTLTSALLDRGAAHLAEKDYGAAKADLDTALAVRKSADGFLNRAMARLGLFDTVGAQKDARQAKSMNIQILDQRTKQLSDLIAKAGGQKSDDQNLAQYLQQLALIDLVNNHLDDAESLVKRAMAIQEKKLSASDLKNTVNLMLLGSVNLQKHSMLKAEALFRSALARLHGNPASAKYAVFGLEECAKVLIQSGNFEQAGSILADTRLQRSATGISEQIFTGDLGRQADRALDAYRQKRKQDQQSLVSKPSDNQSSETSPDQSKRKRRIESPIRDKWAVIVGISDFQDSSINLRYAAKDAKDFRDFLVKEKNFAPDHVQLLTDKAATRANILSALGNRFLPRVAERNDLVIIYFSTHGSPSSLDIGGLNYLVAHDTDINDLYATGIAMQDLVRIIKGRVLSERVMLVLDACHSGGATPGSKGLTRAQNIDAESLAQGTGQLVISSSQPDQVSWESKRYEGSVFTKYLIEGLKSDGEMTKLGNAIKHLQEETEREVLRDRGANQTPVIKSEWEGSDLIIGVPPAAPSPGLTDFLPQPAEPKTAVQTSQKKSGAKGKH